MCGTLSKISDGDPGQLSGLDMGVFSGLEVKQVLGSLHKS